MNTIMSTASLGMTNPAAAQGAGTSSAAQQGSGGFAGALVQALGGGAGASQANAGLQALPVNLAGWFGQLGQLGLASQTGQSEAASGQAGETDWMALVGALLQTLQPGADDQTGASEDAANDPLTGLLAALQTLLQQAQPKTDEPAPADDAAANAQAGEGSAAVLAMLQQLALIQLPSAIGSVDGDLTASDTLTTSGVNGSSSAWTFLLPALLETVQQAANAAAANPDETANPAAQLLEQFKQALASASGGEAAVDAVQPAESLKATVQPLPLSESVQRQQPSAAASAMPAETRKAVSAFKEPVVLWNWIGHASASEAHSDSPVVASVGETHQAGDDGAAASGWTLIGQDAAKQANAETGKPALPAQVPVRQFAQEIGNYAVKQFVLTGGNGVAEARLSLHPEHLGQVDVRIAMQDGQMTAQFVTHSGTAKELLENQMSLLRTALQSQGIQVDRMEVVQQPSGLTDQTAAFQGQEQRQSDSGRGGKEPSGRSRGGEYEDPVDFEAEMERSSAMRAAGYGSSINVTA
ncbi:flagellar hook-length control protein FliK [Cohnella thermotolerans]|uniref:flagellar hook-length control protein FliK n=1 Tax=Cohnella thermotolerans TaxID=329858 RepID=UPI000423FCDC|nr:flagellar hook-length control protein FliK [Cohnella thermotolerans]